MLIVCSALSVQVDVTASAATLQTALNAMPNVAGAVVTRANQVGSEGYIWSITFAGATMPGNIPQITLQSVVLVVRVGTRLSPPSPALLRPSSYTGCSSGHGTAKE